MWARLCQSLGKTCAKLGQDLCKAWARLCQSLGKTWAKRGQDFAKAWARLVQSLGRTSPKLGQDLCKAWAGLRQSLGKTCAKLGQDGRTAARSSKLSFASRRRWYGSNRANRGQALVDSVDNHSLHLLPTRFTPSLMPPFVRSSPPAGGRATKSPRRP